MRSIIRSAAGAEKKGGGVAAGSEWHDEQPDFVLLDLRFVGDAGEADHASDQGDRLVIIMDDEGDVAEGLGL
jgi:hypothetical protein